MITLLYNFPVYLINVYSKPPNVFIVLITKHHSKPESCNTLLYRLYNTEFSFIKLILECPILVIYNQ